MLGDVIGKFKHNPFLQDRKILQGDRDNLIKIIEGNQADEIALILFEAFNHFMDNPEDYDGATGDEESGANKKYDIPSIIHDYLSVMGLDIDFRLMRLTDKLFVAHMKALNFNSYQIGKRKAGLWMVSIFRWIRAKWRFTFNSEYRDFISKVNLRQWRKKVGYELIILT